MRRLALGSALITLIGISGCQESLPTWSRPEIQLAAVVYTENPIDVYGEGGPPPLSVDVTNTTGNAGTDQLALPVPYRIRVSLTIYLKRDPDRRVSRSADGDFNEAQYDLVPGRTVRVGLGILPYTDRDGYAWNWGLIDRVDHVVVIQGVAKINEIGVEINIPPREITFHYVIPDP